MTPTVTATEVKQAIELQESELQESERAWKRNAEIDAARVIADGLECTLRNRRQK